MFESNTSNTPHPGVTLKAYADAKHIPLNTLLTYGVSDVTLLGQPAVRMPYRDREGNEPGVRLRMALDGDNKFRWKTGSKPCLYGLWRLHGGPAVTIVEGESDCHTLWSCGVEAVGLPGASNWREARDASELTSYERIYLVMEPDTGGEAVQRWLARSAIRERVWLLDLAPFKDPSALYLDDPERFSERWQAAIEKAVSWTAQAEATRHQDRDASYLKAKALLEDPYLLERIGRTMQQSGYAGDVTPPLLGYIALTSRFLDRPMNLSYVAQSAAGKNRAVDAATALMPKDAYHEIDAGSDRALIYTDEPYEHRVLIFGEADSIPDEGAAASAVRNLAEKNYLAYDVVEKDPKTGQHQTRHVMKPGPTGLITTSTRSLPHQMNTRVLEIPIPDDATQTRAVLKSKGKDAAGTAPQAPDLAPYLALQRYLATQAYVRVVVPYAEVLADLVPAQAVRMRRDFGQLLTCIKAIAVLYQCQRSRLADGAIVATIEDYTQARTLLAPIFDMILADGVTQALRKIVGEVKSGEEVSISALAQRLTLAKSTVSYHVGRAVHGGWLINLEVRKGHSARLTLGAPLPEQACSLPDPFRVVEVFECSTDGREVFEATSHTLSHVEPTKSTRVFECSNESAEEATTSPPSRSEDRCVCGCTMHPSHKVCFQCGRPRAEAT